MRQNQLTHETIKHHSLKEEGAQLLLRDTFNIFQLLQSCYLTWSSGGLWFGSELKDAKLITRRSEVRKKTVDRSLQYHVAAPWSWPEAMRVVLPNVPSCADKGSVSKVCPAATCIQLVPSWCAPKPVPSTASTVTPARCGTSVPSAMALRSSGGPPSSAPRPRPPTARLRRRRRRWGAAWRLSRRTTRR